MDSLDLNTFHSTIAIQKQPPQYKKWQTITARANQTPNIELDDVLQLDKKPESDDSCQEKWYEFVS